MKNNKQARFFDIGGQDQFKNSITNIQKQMTLDAIVFVMDSSLSKLDNMESLSNFFEIVSITDKDSTLKASNCSELKFFYFRPSLCIKS